MKRTPTRPVHARSNEHLRLHRTRPTTPPIRNTQLPRAILANLGPVGPFAASVVADWATFESIILGLVLVVPLLKTLCVVVSACIVIRPSNA